MLTAGAVSPCVLLARLGYEQAIPSYGTILGQIVCEERMEVIP